MCIVIRMDSKIICICYCVLILIQAICEALLDRVPEEESATKTTYVHVCGVHVCMYACVCICACVSVHVCLHDYYILYIN